MKRFLLTLLVLALAVPAMADVTISVVGNEDLTADIVVVADGDHVDENGSLVAGIALEVSVDNGVIEDVYNYKTTGQSVVGDSGYGIYPGTITFTGGDPEDILSTGTPVAPADAPDAPGQIGSSSIILEFGALYNQATPEAAPFADTFLCTIAVSESCNIALAANATRGGVVLIGGGSVNPVFGSPALVTDPYHICLDHFGPTPAQRALWELLPPEDQITWCYPCFKSGDANGDCMITFTDVSRIINAWPPKPYSADADINQDGAITFTDLSVIINHWPPKDGCDASCNHM